MPFRFCKLGKELWCFSNYAFLGVLCATESESTFDSVLYLFCFILLEMLCTGIWILCSSTGTDVCCCSDGLGTYLCFAKSCGAKVHSLISLFSLSRTSFLAFSSCCWCFLCRIS